VVKYCTAWQTRPVANHELTDVLPRSSNPDERVVAAHAVRIVDGTPQPDTVCGYRPQQRELDANRAWRTTWVSSRCRECGELTGAEHL
jgi:hypothetical protein